MQITYSRSKNVSTRGLSAGKVAVLAILLAAFAPPGVMQSRAFAVDPPKKAAEPAEEKPADPEDITVVTKDGITIHATFYAGNAGKKSIPVILVHGWKGRRTQFNVLAKSLQARGHSVIVPDLRGHGDSNKRKTAAGTEETIDLDKFKTAEIPTFLFDMEAIKKFLTDKNNAGELNIEALCVVGVEFGALVAMNWAALDWSWVQLPTIKQGQDVKGLVLISPEAAYKAWTNKGFIQHPVSSNRDVSILLTYGEQDNKVKAEMTKFVNMVKKGHITEKEEPKEVTKRTLIVQPKPTTLQGMKLIESAPLGLDKTIAGFIQVRLVAKLGDYAWTNRKRD